jgi:hypothetical protein
MNSTFTDALVTVGSMIIGIAALSIILSPKAKTVGVVQAVASGFSNSLGTAMSPVTGERVSVNTSYPGDGFDLGDFDLSDYLN